MPVRSFHEPAKAARVLSDLFDSSFRPGFSRVGGTCDTPPPVNLGTRSQAGRDRRRQVIYAFWEAIAIDRSERADLGRNPAGTQEAWSIEGVGGRPAGAGWKTSWPTRRIRRPSRS
jgi:hypothetical protein